MKYLVKDNKVEFSGSKKQVIHYIRATYEDDYWVQQYGNIFEKDYCKFLYTLECLGYYITDNKPKRKKNK